MEALLFKKDKVGFYRDDSLALVKINQGGRTVERKIKPILNKIFNSEGLKITVDPASQITIDYLDVKFNLSKHTNEPYKKPIDKLVYINVESNHPPHIQKHILRNLNLNQRLSNLSSTNEAFDCIKVPYQKALDEAGHKYNLVYQKATKPKKCSRTLYISTPLTAMLTINRRFASV